MIQIDTTNRIVIDGKPSGLAVAQHLAGSTVYKPETSTSAFQEIRMPKSRYTLSTEAGRNEFETDIKAVLAA